MHFHSHILWFPIGLICIVKANNINILAEFFDFSPLNYNRIYKKLDFYTSSINQSKIYFDTLELENQWSCYNHDVILGNHIQLFNQYNSSFTNPMKGFLMDAQSSSFRLLSIFGFLICIVIFRKSIFMNDVDDPIDRYTYKWKVWWMHFLNNDTTGC